MYGYGKKEGDGLLIQMSPPAMQRWDIQAGDTNVYFLSGTFSVAPPTNDIPKDFEVARAVWSGTLDLPKMKIAIQKP